MAKRAVYVDTQTGEVIAAAPTPRPPIRPQPRGTHPGRRQDPRLAQANDDLVQACVNAGKFPSDRADHWREQLRADSGVAEWLLQMEPDPVAVEHIQASGGAVQAASPVTGEPYPAHWLALGGDPSESPQLANPPQTTTDRARHGRHEIDAGSGPFADRPAPEAVTFEEPGMQGVGGGAGALRDREVRRDQSALQHPHRISEAGD